MDKITREQVISALGFDGIKAYYESEFGEGLGRINRDGNISENMICPFHNDTDASLSINVHTGVFNCFACGGGSIFDFQIKKYVKRQRNSLCVKAV